MSQPRQIPYPHPQPQPQGSPTPSKSSLRRPSDPPRSLLPSPHFDETLPQHDSVVSKGIEESSSLQQATFQPFFTLISDTLSNEHHHPTIHYIFADDEEDILTEAALRSVYHADPAPAEDGGHGVEQQDEEDEGPRLPPPHPHIYEHYLVIDVEPTATTATTDIPTRTYTVTNASSLSPDWQVLQTDITIAPTFDGEEQGGLMLKIEGRGGTPVKEMAKEGLEEMIERFQSRLGDIRRTMEASAMGVDMNLDQEEHEQGLE